MVKRSFDFFLSGIVLFLIWPLLLIVAVLVKIDSKGPVFFVQRRIGKNDKEFLMYKFRTMAIGTPEVATDQLANSANYITGVGYYLRKFSIDELPQLINILKGDMSIVGPRPALYNQYALRQRRNEVGVSKLVPGLTGWAQVNGRDDIALEDKVRLDAEYLAKKTFLFDLIIIGRTAFHIAEGSGERR